MNRRYLMTFALSLTLVAPALMPRSAHADGVSWQTLSVDDALALAGQRESLVLLDVYATWCGPCQRLDAEVFPTDVVGGATADLVALRVNAEAGEGPAIAERFHVVGYPTVLLLQPDGTEIDRVFGFMPAEEFARTVTGYRRGEGTIDDLRRQVAERPSDRELVFQLGFRAAVRGEYDEARTLLDRVIAEDSDNALGLRAQAHLVLGKYMYLRGSGDFAAALAQFDILREQFPDTDEAHEAAFQSAIAYARSGNDAMAAQIVDTVIAQDPDNVQVYNSVAWACYRENFDLPRGIQIAQRGLAIDPTAAYLWDTLAELQNAVGDVAGAIASTEQARQLEPEEAYYRRQYERFTALAADTPVEATP